MNNVTKKDQMKVFPTTEKKVGRSGERGRTKNCDDRILTKRLTKYLKNQTR